MSAGSTLQPVVLFDSSGAELTVVPVGDAGGSITTDTPQLPAVLVGGRLDANAGAWLGSTAPTVGQKAMASSLPVAVASDQAPVPTKSTCATGANASVAAATSDTLILAANANRRGATVYNDAALATLRLLLGSTAASATNYTLPIAAGGYFEVPFGYTGEVRGIWTLAVGNARITELT